MGGRGASTRGALGIFSIFNYGFIVSSWIMRHAARRAGAPPLGGVGQRLLATTFLPIPRRTVRFRRPVLHVQLGNRWEKTFGCQAGLLRAKEKDMSVDERYTAPCPGVETQDTYAFLTPYSPIQS